jgi:hypothetical protein
MARNVTREEFSAEAVTRSTAVDFALVLSRMIDSVNADPEQLRSTVYELARLKLGEQSLDTGPDEQRRLAGALETAIQGVETHFSQLRLQSLEGPGGRTPRLGPPAQQAIVPRTTAAVGPATRDAEFESRPLPPFEDQRASDWSPRTARRRWKFTAPWRFVTVLAVVALVGFAVRQRIDPTALGYKIGSGLRLSAVTPKPAALPAEQVQPGQEAASSTIPTAFGIYAVSNDKLYPLELLPGRAPDARVAVSAAISTPSKTMLPDPHIRFIVFRRDSASNALDRAEVRVIAKIAQAMTFDAGKPVISKTADSWVIRNISTSYQTAPLKGKPDMYEVLNEDTNKVLEPGRYALVLKGEAYDFSVAGEVRDPRQCLESVAAANGAFYSECQKPR